MSIRYLLPLLNGLHQTVTRRQHSTQNVQRIWECILEISTLLVTRSGNRKRKKIEASTGTHQEFVIESKSITMYHEAIKLPVMYIAMYKGETAPTPWGW
ncbi:hypothetical protein OK016_17895 [Vibrio chagasii]|nr:hypothetical protein [Vibrio chagasii]